MITRVLIRKRGGQESQRRCEGRSRGQSDGIPGSENERRPGAKERRQPVEAVNEKNRFSHKSSRKNPALQIPWL